MITTNDTAVFGELHALRVEDGQYALYTRTADGLQPVGRYESPAIAMNVLDLLDDA